MEKVSLIKAESYQEQLKERLVALLQPLGGLEAFCKSGDQVLLKPNLLTARSAESGVTTHPAIIMGMVGLLKDLGCRVAIGDSPGIGSAMAVFSKLGIVEDLRKHGVKMVEFERGLSHSEIKRSLKFERRFKNLEVAACLNEFDQVINLAKLKAHGQMGLTLATKNLYGCVVGPNKGQWHFTAGKDRQAFARLLVEIALTANASLHIIDGIVGMDGNGPSNGKLHDYHVLLAGSNPLAVDRMVVELIQMKPEQFPIFAAAREIGVAGVGLEEINLAGEPLAGLLIKDFEVPTLLGTNLFLNPMVSRMIEGLIKPRLLIDQSLCIKCRKCLELCPAEAIKLKDRVLIDETNCIKCCCCQEICPVGALSVRDPWLLRLLRKS